MIRKNEDDRVRLNFRSAFAALVVAPLLVSAPASATVHPVTGTVTQMITYPQFGGGDFTFRLSSYVPACSGGYWISPDWPGFKTTVALILSARARGQTLLVGANDAVIWTGSASPYCKIEWVIEEG